jgi:D-glycero-D-manno-heptose 1,7-bisphosphate phosphatase
MTPAVALLLLDRDGTVNVKAPEGEYVTAPAVLELLPGAAEAIARANGAGVPVALVTNQRGVALGRMSERDLDAVHAELAAQLAGAGARVDAIFACVHERGTCSCRKPDPGLLLEALARFEVAPSDAVMIGDADSDVEAGRRAGVRTIRIDPAARRSPDRAVAPTLLDAVATVLGA